MYSAIVKILKVLALMVYNRIILMMDVNPQHMVCGFTSGH